MSDGKRPGGLTALAVLNFVFGGVDCLQTFGLAIAMGIKSGAIPLDGPDKEEALKGLGELPDELLYGLTAFHLVSGFLLIATGVGYLKQSRFWGRTLGSISALVWMGGYVALAALAAEEAGGGFTLWTVVLVIYPGLTLILLNTTFKEDFVR